MSEEPDEEIDAAPAAASSVAAAPQPEGGAAGLPAPADGGCSSPPGSPAETPVVPPAPLDLDAVDAVEDLAALPLDRLKAALQALGMKCGGTAQQRAERLWSVRGLPQADIPPQLLAGSGRGGGRRRK